MRANWTGFKLLLDLFARHGLETYMESTHSLFVLLNEGGKLIAWNHSFDSFRDALPESALLRDLLHPSSKTHFDLLLSTATHDRVRVQGQLELGPGGFFNEYSCFLLPMPEGYILFAAEPVQIQTELEEARAELHRLEQLLERKETELQAVIAQADEVSHTDPLTFLPNRRQIMIDLQNAVEFSERYGTPLSISMLDIDYFKKINDMHGHSAGDDVLRDLAGKLRSQIRHPDSIGRFGGEEFLIVLPHSTLKAAVDQAARLCELIRSTSVTIGEQALPITVSIGIAQHKLHKEDWQSLLNRADAALYQAKSTGRDKWVVSEE